MSVPLFFLRLTYPLTSQLPAELALRLANAPDAQSFSRNATMQIASVVCGLILFGLAWFDKLPDILVNEQCDFTSLLNG